MSTSEKEPVRGHPQTDEESSRSYFNLSKHQHRQASGPQQPTHQLQAQARHFSFPEQSIAKSVSCACLCFSAGECLMASGD